MVPQCHLEDPLLSPKKEGGADLDINVTPLSVVRSHAIT